ncbi:MAG: glycosyltransferase family 4 protein [Planctomycetes bacterium]|nr:glycosyltransferase family 4 protein [Planctomycetota bacterium]
MSRSYRILYHHRIRADDGQAVHVREVIGALRAAGHDVHEAALVPKTGVAPTVRTAARAPSFWQRLSLPRPAIEVAERLYNRTGRRLLRAAAAQCRPDFVYERHALHCHAGLDVARELGVPLLLEVNSPMVDEMQKLGKLWFRGAALRTERQVLGAADAVLAVTEVLGQMLVQRGARPAAVHVVGNGAVPERYDAAARAAAVQLRAQWALPAGAFVLGFIGYMRPWHRLDLVLDVMSRPGFGELVLVLAGAGPALPMLRARAAALGLGARFLALGEVPPAELPAHVLALDAALIPAINAYASPLKLFDSLAAGVPTLAPDQPNLRENLQDGQNGLLFQPGSADALAAALGRLVQDRAFAARLGAAGRQSLLAQRWTWAGNAERIAAIAARVLEARR